MLRYCENCEKVIPGDAVEVDELIFCSIECAEEAALEENIEAESGGDVPTPVHAPLDTPPPVIR